MAQGEELLQILGALSQHSIDKDRLNRGSAQHANTLDANRQAHDKTIAQQNLAILKDSLKTASLQANQNEFNQTMRDSTEARNARNINRDMNFKLALKQANDAVMARMDSSDKAHKIDMVELTHKLAGKSDSLAYERAKNAKRTVDPNWTPNIYGMKADSDEFFKETRGIGSEGNIASRTLGSMINPYDDSDIISGYNKMHPLLQSDVSQVQKKGVDPKHKEELVRFLIDAFNRVNKSEFADDDFFWEDDDRAENAVREDIISKLLQLDYPIDRNTPLNKKVNYK
jgi:hypothetical protein